jgi:hypothetical protein
MQSNTAPIAAYYDMVGAMSREDADADGAGRFSVAARIIGRYSREGPVIREFS